MRTISFNANGIRAAGRRGFFDWLTDINPDVLCVQELKAQAKDLDDALFNPAGYYRYAAYAQKPGYSGVAIYSKHQAHAVVDQLDWPLSHGEGRYVEIELDSCHVVSIYLPSGSSGDVRQTLKFEFLERYQAFLDAQLKSNKPYIICGDFNIVHREIDIRNFKSNQKNSGCLPEERAWIDYLISEQGWVDAFRAIEPGPDHYTWWSNRGRARENNVGWRIDYQLVSPQLADAITAASVYKEQWFSDHAPLIIDYDDKEMPA